MFFQFNDYNYKAKLVLDSVPFIIFSSSVNFAWFDFINLHKYRFYVQKINETKMPLLIIFLFVCPSLNRHGLRFTHIRGTNIWPLHLLLPCGSLYVFWHRAPCINRWGLHILEKHSKHHFNQEGWYLCHVNKWSHYVMHALNVKCQILCFLLLLSW